MQPLIVATIFYFISSSTLASRASEQILDLNNLNDLSFPLSTGYICKYKAGWTTINVYNSSFTVLPSRLLKNCEFLDQLNLSNNKIVKIKHNAFENLPDLNILDLSLNQITTLSRDIFEPLIALVRLQLQGNKIRTIDPDLFRHNEYLYDLDLSNNNLKIIHTDLFIHNEHLFDLNLSNNSLKVIQPKSFRNNPNLNNLYVTDNHYLSGIDLFPENRGIIQILELSNCGFSELYIPKNVETIHAQFNKINSITAHPKSVLWDLNIDHNNLTDLAHLPALNNLKRLRMLENDIKFIDFNHLSHFDDLSLLSINLNPMQTINAADIQTNFPKLRYLFIDSPDMSIDQQQSILDNLEQTVCVVFPKEPAKHGKKEICPDLLMS